MSNSYESFLNHILTHGEDRGDRTNTGTRSVFGHQMRFDLSEGQIPLITTKKMFTRGMLEELLWFIRGSTDVTELQDKGVNFWNSWVDENNTIGHGYGKQLRKIISYVPVIPKIFEASPLKVLHQHGLVEPDFASDTGKTAFKVGQYLTSKVSGAFRLIRQGKNLEGRANWVVQFTDTGYMREASYRDLQSLSISDPFFRSVFEVGYYGEQDYSDPHHEVLVNTWRDMIRRCYYKNSKSYKSYGAKGVHVSEDWHCFATFQKEVKTLPGWPLKVVYPSDYSLDKDVLWASNRYGVDTCKWASDFEQGYNTSTSRPFTATSQEDVEVTFPTIGDSNRTHGLNLSAVSRCLLGALKTHHGYRNFQYLPVPVGHVMRVRVIDQLKEVIAGLKVNPDSRRHVITTWNPQDVDRTTLPPCHGTVIQFYVSDGMLSCQMYQRSADAMLGVPVNIASYSVLTLMVAKECGLSPGEFIWVGGDCHIYNNHMDQVKEQLTRDPYPFPKLNLLNDKDFFNYAVEDFELVGYKHHPAIPAPVAV